MNRTIAIGDIHGCFHELQDLLDKAGPTDGDSIIALGDIVDRGPEPAQVLEFFRITPNALSLMGNHERKHIRSYRGHVRPALSQLITRHQIGEDAYTDAVTYMATFPLYKELDDAVLVHGFWEPGVQTQEQKEVVLVGTMGGNAHLKERLDRPWYELYDGEKPLVAGHLDYLQTGKPLIADDRVFCLDTGCSHGGRLTALVLPEFEIVSVPSRGNHWDNVKAQYKPVVLRLMPSAKDPWERIKRFLFSVENQEQVDADMAERAVELRKTLSQAEEALEEMFQKICAENIRILEQLELEARYSCQPERDQGRLYAAAMGGKHPFTAFLHEARRGRFTKEYLRRALPSPAKVLAAVKKLEGK